MRRERGAATPLPRAARLHLVGLRRSERAPARRAARALHFGDRLVPRARSSRSAAAQRGRERDRERRLGCARLSAWSSICGSAISAESRAHMPLITVSRMVGAGGAELAARVAATARVAARRQRARGFRRAAARRAGGGGRRARGEGADARAAHRGRARARRARGAHRPADDAATERGAHSRGDGERHRGGGGRGADGGRGPRRPVGARRARGFAARVLLRRSRGARGAHCRRACRSRSRTRRST